MGRPGTFKEIIIDNRAMTIYSSGDPNSLPARFDRLVEIPLGAVTRCQLYHEHSVIGLVDIVLDLKDRSEKEPCVVDTERAALSKATFSLQILPAWQFEMDMIHACPNLTNKKQLVKDHALGALRLMKHLHPSVDEQILNATLQQTDGDPICASEILKEQARSLEQKRSLKVSMPVEALVLSVHSDSQISELPCLMAPVSTEMPESSTGLDTAQSDNTPVELFTVEACEEVTGALENSVSNAVQEQANPETAHQQAEYIKQTQSRQAIVQQSKGRIIATPAQHDDQLKVKRKNHQPKQQETCEISHSDGSMTITPRKRLFQHDAQGQSKCRKLPVMIDANGSPRVAHATPVNMSVTGQVEIESVHLVRATSVNAVEPSTPGTAYPLDEPSSGNRLSSDEEKENCSEPDERLPLRYLDYQHVLHEIADVSST